jgi:hypothetical protein
LSFGRGLQFSLLKRKSRGIPAFQRVNGIPFPKKEGSKELPLMGPEAGQHATHQFIKIYFKRSHFGGSDLVKKKLRNADI